MNFAHSNYPLKLYNLYYFSILHGDSFTRRLTASQWVSLSVPLCPSLSVCLSLSVSFSLFQSLSLSVSLSLSLPLCLSLPVYLSPSVRQSISACIFVTVRRLFLPVSVSTCISVIVVYLSLCLYICDRNLSISLPVYL